MLDVLLQPWSEEDLPLLQKLLGDPEMMVHLGGPETPEQIARRHQRYLQLPETDHMFKIVSSSTSEPFGSIGYWEKTWRDRPVYETGWSILPAYQRQGIATKAGEAVIEYARREHRHRCMHAFPSTSNAASNAICRKLGFALLEECEFEYPPGNALRVNDWQLDL
jgi:RimJ/RimL family protein N-acetyltransferase